MGKKTITDVENRIEKILADTARESTELEEKIEVFKMEQNEENDAMEVATINSDLKAYQKAKAEYGNASDAIEMHTRRLDTLKNKPLISSVDFEKGVAQIMTALGEVTADAKKEIIGHVEAIRVIAAECQAEIKKGNKLLHQWQHDIYMDDAKITVANGNKVHMDNLEKKYGDFSVIQFAEHILESGHYKHFTGQK